MHFAGENVLVKCESSSAMDGSSAELGPWHHRGAIAQCTLTNHPGGRVGIGQVGVVHRPGGKHCGQLHDAQESKFTLAPA